jgi:Holliday junction resolvase-like predicted endonuclease
MPFIEPRQKFGRKVERMITQYLEDLDPNYVVYSNATELGPIDLVVVNLASGKSVFVDCKGTKSNEERRHVPPKISNREKWKHLDRWFIMMNEKDEIHIRSKKYLKNPQNIIREFKKALK